MSKVKRFHFTLLELLIVLCIISCGVALTGVKVKQMYQQQRFLSESQQVLSHLAMAQDLMLIANADVIMKLTKDPTSKQVTFWLEVDKPLEERWAHLIERKVALSAIQSYQFQFEGEKESHDKVLALHFSLGKMSRGMLTLWAEEESMQIELPGYPHSLKVQLASEEKQATGKSKTEKSKELYPVEVYQALYESFTQNGLTS